MVDNRLTLELMAFDRITPVMDSALANVRSRSKSMADALDKPFQVVPNSIKRFNQTGVKSLFDGFKPLISNFAVPSLQRATAPLTAVLGKYSNVAKGIASTSRSAVSGISSGITKMFGKIAPQILIANAAAALFGATLGSLPAAVNQAGRIQLMSLSTAQGLGNNLGISFDESRKLLKVQQLEISKIAAALPGDTQSYSDIYGGVLTAISGNYVGRIDEFKENSLELTKKLGVLASLSNVTGTEAASTVAKLLGGTAGFEEVSLNDLIQKNPLFKQQLNKQASFLGLDVADWKQWTATQREQVVKAALDTTVTDNLTTEMQNTTASLLESIKSKIFDPVSGLFGLLRDINGRTGMDSLKDYLIQLTKLGETFTAILSQGGLNLDPMEGLISMVDWLTGILKSINGFIWGATIADIPTMIGAGMAGMADMLLNGLRSIPDDFTANIFAFLLNITAAILSSGFLGKLVEIFIALSVTLVRQVLGVIFSPDIWMSLIRVAIGAVIALFDLVLSLVRGVLVESVRALMSLGSWLLDLLKGVLTSVLPSLGGGLSGMAGGVVSSIVEPAAALGSGAVDWAKDVFGKITGTSNPDKKSDTFAPNVNVNTNASDPKEVASAVMGAIQSAYSQYQMIG